MIKMAGARLSTVSRSITWSVELKPSGLVHFSGPPCRPSGSTASNEIGRFMLRLPSALEAIVPYTEHEITLDDAWNRGIAPIRQFMTMQIERTGNSDDVHLFLDYIHNGSEETPTTYDEVPMSVLLPAFVLSELKTAFLIGFQIFLPFLILDMVVASIMVSMGMMMLPPVLISLPFKLLLFVLLDGWTLVVSMLLSSFAFVT